jgi:SAM-dependent methyltransferase
MKMFLVTFAIEALVILIAVAIIYNVYSALRGIVRMVKRHRDKQKALDKIYRATALFRKMDCHALDFPDATFDLIISRNVVWTLYDPTKAYGEWTRVLKPKGSIVVFDAAWNKEFHNQSIMDRKNAARRSLGKKEMAQYLGDQDLCEELDQRSVLGNEDRPAWDRACLEKLGLDVKIDEKAYMTLWDEETRLLNEATPLFMIQASKR